MGSQGGCDEEVPVRLLQALHTSEPETWEPPAGHRTSAPVRVH